MDKKLNLLFLVILCTVLIIGCCTDHPGSISSEDSLAISKKFLENHAFKFDYPDDIKNGKVKIKSLKIDKQEAQAIHKAFLDRIMLPGDTSAPNGVIIWPRDRKGWSIPAASVDSILHQPGAAISKLWLYMGMNPKTQTPSLILVGSYIDPKSGKDRLMFGKTDPIITRNGPITMINGSDEVYEYIEPCKNNCPDNGL